ncbi:MAG: hypothetical protein NZ853_10325 [Leptospiraceae bacterium]|nr:hypothetical protein [Leptospiraceae bacterium]MDW7974947.1 hypothetical protein [Leptospiraceae bacterium]
MPWDWKRNQPYGVYKKILLPPEKLQEELHFLRPHLLLLRDHYYRKSKSPEQIAYEFFLLYYTQRNKGKRLFNTKNPPLEKMDQSLVFLNAVRLFRIPDTIRLTLIHWLSHKWKIQLLDYNPSSYEMLKFQANGVRIVTIDWEHALSGKYVFGIRDAFEHFLHDLEHCYNFYHNYEWYQSQKEVFNKLLEFYPEIEWIIQREPDFQAKWDYLISDMNSHPQHLKEYTKAIFFELLNKKKDIIPKNVREKIENLLQTF